MLSAMRGFWYDMLMDEKGNQNNKTQEIQDLIASQEKVYVEAKASEPQKSKSFVSWARRRQIAYILIILFALSALGAYPAYKFYNQPASCFDGKQNQSELGVDCGGECDIFCKVQVKDIVVNWVDIVFVKNGVYDIAASVENPNPLAGIESIDYVFKVYDEDDLLITEKTGSTFVDPRESFVIFESGIRIDSSIPTRTTIEFEDNPIWIKMEDRHTFIRVKNKQFLEIDESPKLSVTLLNDSIDDLFGVEITAVISNRDDDIVGVSSTYEEIIRKKSSSKISFTWPTPFVFKHRTGCTAPTDVVLLFDRSGSMEFGGKNPPEPLTSAKEAAILFLDSIQPFDKVGLVSFASVASEPIDQSLTSSLSLVRNAINSIFISSPSIEQHTNIGDGFDKATTELMSSRSNEESKKAIVLLTDGVASRPLNPEKKSDKDYPDNYAREKAFISKDNDISIYVIGLGDSVNEEFLSSVISSGQSYYYKADTSLDLKGIYSEIARAVCEEETFITDITIRTIRDTI